MGGFWIACVFPDGHRTSMRSILVRLPKPKCDAQIAGGKVAAAAADRVVLRQVAGHTLTSAPIPSRLLLVPMVFTRMEWFGFLRAWRSRSGEPFMLLTMISRSPSLS